MVNNKIFFSTVVYFFIFIANNLFCDEKYFEIKSLEYPDDKIIYLGVFGEDGGTSQTKLSLKSLVPNTKLMMLNTSPTMTLTRSDTIFNLFPPGLLDFSKFRVYHRNLDFFSISLFKDTIKDTLVINFSPQYSDNIGRNEAVLILGFANANDIDSPNLQDTIKLDTFYLIGKKTSLFIDGFDDFIYFDSVFINQKQPIYKEWRARNVTVNNLNATGQSYNLLSATVSENPFTVEEKKYPLTFLQGDNSEYHSWNFGYNPTTVNSIDSAIFKLFFQPFPNNPQQIDTAKVKLYGIGVQHSLNIIETENCEKFLDTVNEFNKIDTINIGKVRVGATKNAKITLRNVGNINYSLKNQTIYDEISDKEVNYFKVLRNFCENSKYLDINDDDFVEITFSPDRKGDFIARFVIENDFENRKIKSNNQNDYKKTIILRGIGVESILELTVDTVDFGNINYPNSEIYCPNKKDTVITILNVGNSELIISNIEINNNSYFQLEHSNLSIPANSKGQITLTFSSTYPEKSIESILTFKTNETNQNRDTIFLFARTIPPIEADLSIPYLSNKPGTILSVPILLKSNNSNHSNENASSYGSSYNLNLRFNNSMLVFDSEVTVNTASEGCKPIIDTTEDGLLKINVSKDFSYFYNSDTLLILNFQTFLGNSGITALALDANAKIGNNNCDDFMKLNISNGRYSIDSICGLDYKLQNTNELKFNFEINQNISSDKLEFNFTLPFQTDAKIGIYNSLGDEIMSENYYFLPYGTFNKSLLLNNLNSGTYYVLFSSGLYKKIIPFIKN